MSDMYITILGISKALLRLVAFDKEHMKAVGLKHPCAMPSTT